MRILKFTSCNNMAAQISTFSPVLLTRDPFAIRVRAAYLTSVIVVMSLKAK